MPESPEPSAEPSKLPETVDPSRAAPKRPASWRRPSTVIAVVALVLLGWQWLETRQRVSGLQEELARRLADSDAVAKEARLAARQTQETQAALLGKVGALEAQLADIQGQQVALDAVYQELSKTGDERLLAEVEQALAIAAQQLRLAGNVETALIALTGAEARLARAGRPQFLGLRKLIDRDIERLKASPTADLPGLAMKIEGIVAAVDALPLAYEHRPKAETPRPAVAASPTEMSFWRSLLADFWAEARQLVRIERVDASGVDPALLSPSQSFFLRENLKLRLLNARLALLARDDRGFREDVRQAAAWLERYFDGGAKSVQASQATLKAMAAADVGADAPGLEETLEAVRNFRLTKDKR